MTKFEIYTDGLARRRQEKMNGRYNEYLATRLQTKTHEEVVEELMRGLTVIVGVGNALAENKEKTLVF